MGKGNPNLKPEAEPEVIEPDQASTSQEAVPVPWMAGERRIAVKWISRTYNIIAVKRYDTPVGKKS